MTFTRSGLGLLNLCCSLSLHREDHLRTVANSRNINKSCAEQTFLWNMERRKYEYKVRGQTALLSDTFVSNPYLFGRATAMPIKGKRNLSFLSVKANRSCPLSLSLYRPTSAIEKSLSLSFICLRWLLKRYLKLRVVWCVCLIHSSNWTDSNFPCVVFHLL